jgi:DNA-binding transcriptional regulator YhcF (GntR family)
MIDLIKIENTSPVPKYKQIIDSIHEALDNRELQKNQKIPSINEICQKFNLSRDTVITAFNDLQARGIIIAKPGKGYYITKSSTNQQHKIFLLFDKLSPYKEVLYDAFKDELSRKGSVEIYFHHFNAKVFETLIRESIGNYTAYVVMPIPSKSIAPAINLIPRDKLYILDRGRRLYGQDYPSVCQNFKEDVYNGLMAASDLLEKYTELFMIFPEPSNIPRDIKRGFERFCKEKNMSHDTITELHSDTIKKGQAYLVFDDKSLVTLVQAAQAQHYQLGKDLGVVSYNDTPLKSVVANGITTISTDFAAMGKTMADLIVNKKKDHLQNPSALITRNSL